MSAGNLMCDYEDEFSTGNHSSFMHRNNSADRDWHIDEEDKKRWGILTTKRKGARVSEGAEVTPSQPDTTEGEPTL